MAALHISDPKADQLVRRLAQQRGISFTQAITLAVENELAKDEPFAEPETPPQRAPLTKRELEQELEAELRATTLDYTRLLAKAKGKKSVGSRVYQMISRHGPVGTLDRLVAKPTPGLLFLSKIDQMELSAEEIALKPKYTSIVSEEIRVRARDNLQTIGRATP
jgi:hypothetical protein